MSDLIPISYDSDRPTVLARDLRDFLEVETPYHKWFPRMCEYGFTENQDYTGLAVFQLFCHREQTLGGSLDRTEVDVCTDKAPAQFHGNCLRGAAAHKAIKNKITRI